MLLQPLHRGLRSDLGHAGHVVDRVADQGQVVDDALGAHAELGQHAGLVERLVRHRVDQRDLRGDQLRQVLVAGGDDHPVAAGRGHPRQRADGVVGLDAGHLQHRPAQQPHHLVDRRDLRAQVVGHRRAVRLVLGIDLVAEGRALGVEDADRVLAGDVLGDAAQHRHEAVDRAGGLAVGAAQVGHGVVGAVEIARAVDQQHRRAVGAGVGIVHGGIVGDRPA